MNIGVSNDQARWYVVRTKPKEEARAESNLRTGQIQTFSPKLKAFRSSGFGAPYVSKPLFSNYIFAHFDAEKQLHNVNYTKGVQKVVNFGGNAISVDDRVIDLIRAQVGEDGFIRMDEEFEPGDKVRIASGPFENLAGIFERKIKDSDRVMLLLGSANFQGHIVVEREVVRRV